MLLVFLGFVGVVSAQSRTLHSPKTGCALAGNHKTQYLDRFNVQCPSGYAMRGWHFMYSHNDSCDKDDRRYQLRCAKFRYSGSVLGTATRYTGCNDIDGKGLHYLDRHNVACASNEVMTGFRLIRSGCGGSNLRYQIQCARVRGINASKYKYTTCNDLRDRNCEYLDRHSTDCASDEAMALWRMEFCSKNDFRIKYLCKKFDDRPNPVSCLVSGWGGWGACNKSCGNGLQYRSRSVTRNAAYGGAGCPSLSESKSCKIKECPRHCAVGGFGGWGACDKSCGPGQQTRTRSITQNAAYGGNACPSLFQKKSCKIKECPRHCAVGGWGAWGTCSKSCGPGEQTRTRSITQNAAYHGNACPNLSEKKACKVKECPINCEVSDWSEFTECSEECGGGVQQRIKTITKPAQHGGSCPAPASLIEEQECNTQKCETPAPTICDGNASKYVGTQIKVKKGESRSPKLQGGDDYDPVCECYDLCAAIDNMVYFQYYMKKDSPKCMCYGTGKMNAKPKTGYTSGYLTENGKKQLDKKTRTRRRRGGRRDRRRRRG